MLLAIAVTFILVQGENVRSGPNVSLDVALAKRDAYGSDFLWFKKDRHEYLIRDAATLQHMQALFERTHAYKAEAKRAKREVRALEMRESQLDRQIDALADRDRLTAAEEDQLRDFRRELDTLRSQLRPLEVQADELERKRAVLEAEAERAMLPMLDDAIRSGVAAQIR